MTECFKNCFKMKGRAKEKGKNKRKREEEDEEEEVEEEERDSGSGIPDHFGRMDQFFQDPFMNSGLLALTDNSHGRSRRVDNRRQQQQQQAQNMQVAGRGMFMDPFSHFDSMFTNMRSMMTDMHRAFDQVSTDPNTHVYQQSSVMSYSNTGNGAPKIYQATSSTRQGPGGVKETRKAVRDSETGTEKCSVGHHIRDKAHIIERSKNTHTGEMDQNQELINLDEDDVAPFDREYQDKWQHAMRRVEQRRHQARARFAPIGEITRHALPEPETSRRYRRTSHRRE